MLWRPILIALLGLTPAVARVLLAQSAEVYYIAPATSK